MGKCIECGSLHKPSENCLGKTAKAKQKSRWDLARPKVKPWFDRVGITSCELSLKGCTGSVAVGFAHTKKQRHLSEKELYIVALLCTNCHNMIEGKLWMADTILNIRKRNPIPEIDEIINECYGNNN